jgi:hypothetical protein
MRSRRALTVGVTLFFLLVWAFFTHSHVGSFNDRSRMAAIESLVHRGTWVIDESPFSHTGDRILVDGHFYSDKPPVLTFIASGVYAAINEGLHLSLDAGWCDFDEAPCHCRAFCEESPDWAYYLLTLTLIGFPSALMLALFYHVTTLFGLSNPAALALTATLGLATQVFPYSTVFNSHLPAASALLAGFYALLRAQKRCPSIAKGSESAPWTEGSPVGSQRATPSLSAIRRWLFAAGLLAGLAFTFDLGLGLFFVAFLGYAAWNHRRHAWPYLLGGLLPIAAMAFLDYQIVGNPLPPYMYTQGYDYPGSRFPQTIAGNRSPDNVLTYGLRLLFGDHGLFAFNPVLLWAVASLVQVWRGRCGTKKLARVSWMRAPAALVGLTSGLFVLYFILFTDNFGGSAYGPRWYTAFVPLVFLFVPVLRVGCPTRPQKEAGHSTGLCGIVDRAQPPPRLWGGRRLWGKRLLLLVLVVISCVNSYQGALNPWRKATPLLWLKYAVPGWREPVDAALSGVTFEEIDPLLSAAFSTRRVDKRWFDARSCLVVPSGPTWLFVDPGTPLDPALAERMGLAIPGGAQQAKLGSEKPPPPLAGGTEGGHLTYHIDLRPARDAYVERVKTTAWTSTVLAPRASDSRVRVSLPADFAQQISLLGYELLDDRPERAGEEVALITVWRVKQRLRPPLSMFVHLLDPRGHIAGQHDGLGANPAGLRPGDVLLQVHRFTIPPDSPPGHYWLQLGLYNPETMSRLKMTGYASDRLLLTQVEIAESK